MSRLKDTEDEKMLKAGISLDKIMEEYDIKPEELKGWEDIEIEEQCTNDTKRSGKGGGVYDKALQVG